MKLFRRKPDAKQVLRALAAYPAVLTPDGFGCFEVCFPNFPRARAGGINRGLALDAAREELTTEVFLAFKNGAAPPPPSDPARLVRDEDEPAGTTVVMIEPDKDVILRRLGLVKKFRRTAPTGDKYEP